MANRTAWRRVLPIALLVFFTGCAATSATPKESHNSVWAVDLIKTKPGALDNYLRFLDLNWKSARQVAVAKGYALSYQVYVVDKADNAAWNILLATEYRDRDVVHRLEEIYATEIFPERGPMIKVAGKGPRELADIVDSQILRVHRR